MIDTNRSIGDKFVLGLTVFFRLPGTLIDAYAGLTLGHVGYDTLEPRSFMSREDVTIQRHKIPAYIL